MRNEETDLGLAILGVAALLVDLKQKGRYEGFVRVVREIEYYLDLPEDDLEQIAAFFVARKRFKALMREASTTAHYEIGTPLPEHKEARR